MVRNFLHWQTVRQATEACHRGDRNYGEIRRDYTYAQWQDL
jgi:hypothetical protein